jgi:hypothetical protein
MEPLPAQAVKKKTVAISRNRLNIMSLVEWRKIIEMISFISEPKAKINIHPCHAQAQPA